MTEGSNAPESGSGAPAQAAAAARTPKGMHDVLWPESSRWETTVARVCGVGPGGRVRPRPDADPRARWSVPAGHRRGHRRRRQGDVRLRGPRRPAHGAAPGRDGAGGPGLRAAPPGPALEGLVRRADVPLRAPPARPLPPAPPARRRGARASGRRPRRRGGRRWRHDFFAGLGLREVELEAELPGRRGVQARATSRCSVRSWRSGSTSSAPAHRVRHLENPLRVLDCKREECRAATADAPHFVDHLCDPVRRPLRAGAGRARRARRALRDRPPARARLRLLHPHHVRVRGPGARRGAERHRRRRAATTAWSSSSAGRPRPGIGFGIGIERVLLACDAEGVFPTTAPPLRRVRRRQRAAESAVALTAELRRAGLRADRAFDGRSHEVADEVGRPLRRAGGAHRRPEGARGRARSTLRPLRSDDEQRTVPRS